MNSAEYKKSRRDSGFKVEQWIQCLDISLSSHKSYSSGRRKVPPRVKRRIALILEEVVTYKK